MYTVIALKHGLECKITEFSELSDAVSYALRYYRRIGIPVRIYDNRSEMIWCSEELTAS